MPYFRNLPRRPRPRGLGDIARSAAGYGAWVVDQPWGLSPSIIPGQPPAYSQDVVQTMYPRAAISRLTALQTGPVVPGGTWARLLPSGTPVFRTPVVEAGKRVEDMPGHWGPNAAASSGAGMSGPGLGWIPMGVAKPPTYMLQNGFSGFGQGGGETALSVSDIETRAKWNEWYRGIWYTELTRLYPTVNAEVARVRSFLVDEALPYLKAAEANPNANARPEYRDLKSTAATLATWVRDILTGDAAAFAETQATWWEFVRGENESLANTIAVHTSWISGMRGEIDALRAAGVQPVPVEEEPSAPTNWKNVFGKAGEIGLLAGLGLALTGNFFLGLPLLAGGAVAKGYGTPGTSLFTMGNAVPAAAIAIGAGAMFGFGGRARAAATRLRIRSPIKRQAWAAPIKFQRPRLPVGIQLPVVRAKARR